MSALYLAGGINHFWNPAFYLKMMPPYLPWHENLNYLSGLAEIVLAILLLFPATRVLAAWGVIALLVAIFPANYYMFQARETVFSALPTWLLIARLPAQGILIAWAYWYT
jgi:uncharacterized membrane protein